jgi:hypothetical protein
VPASNSNGCVRRSRRCRILNAASTSSSPTGVTPSAGTIGWMQKFGQGREVSVQSPSRRRALSCSRMISTWPLGGLDRHRHHVGRQANGVIGQGGLAAIRAASRAAPEIHRVIIILPMIERPQGRLRTWRSQSFPYQGPSARADLPTSHRAPPLHHEISPPRPIALFAGQAPPMAGRPVSTGGSARLIMRGGCGGATDLRPVPAGIHDRHPRGGALAGGRRLRHAVRGPRGNMISTSRHALSDDGRTLSVSDRGFGNVLNGLEFNVRSHWPPRATGSSRSTWTAPRPRWRRSAPASRTPSA